MREPLSSAFSTTGILFTLAGLLVGCDLLLVGSESSRCLRNFDSRGVYETTDSTITGAHPIAFSPSGDRILLEVTRTDGSEHPALVNRDGTGFHLLTGEPDGRDRNAYGFSPDGSKVLYTLGPEIRTIGVDGTGSTQLIAGGAGNDPVAEEIHVVGFSPDGELLLYNVFYASGQGWEINVANADGSNPRRLTDFEERAWAVGFSPDGSTILFNHVTEGDTEVWTMGTNGQNMRNLTEGVNPGGEEGHDQVATVFVAERDRILYRKAGPEGGIMWMDPDGGNKTRITENRLDEPTAITADGSTIGFSSFSPLVGGDLGRSSGGFGLVHSDGTGRTLLQPEQCIPGPIVDFSPDGEQFLLGTERPDRGTQQVRIVKLNE